MKKIGLVIILVVVYFLFIRKKNNQVDFIPGGGGGYIPNGKETPPDDNNGHSLGIAPKKPPEFKAPTPSFVPVTTIHRKYDIYTVNGNI